MIDHIGDIEYSCSLCGVKFKGLPKHPLVEKICHKCKIFLCWDCSQNNDLCFICHSDLSLLHSDKKADKIFKLLTYAQDYKMLIDNANEKDLIPIKEALSVEFLKDYPDILHWFEKSSNEFLTKERPIFTVKLDDEMIGFIMLNRKNSYLKGNAMYIYPGFRRKGYGRKLLEYVENFAIKNNYTSFRFCIKKSRDKAVKFFMDNGYKILKELKDNSEIVYELIKEFPSKGSAAF